MLVFVRGNDSPYFHGVFRKLEAKLLHLFKTSPTKSNCEIVPGISVSYRCVDDRDWLKIANLPGEEVLMNYTSLNGVSLFYGRREKLPERGLHLPGYTLKNSRCFHFAPHQLKLQLAVLIISSACQDLEM